MSQSNSPALCYILANRQQYTTCHVRVPDLEQRLAAIYFGGKFYEFFQSIRDGRRAIALLTKLVYRGDEVVMTKTPKGYGLWVYEPEATPAVPHSLPEPKSAAPCFLLVSHYPHQRVRAEVPDLAQPVDAVRVDQQTYSIFKMDLDADYALEILAKLLQRGDRSLLMPDKHGLLVGVYEPDAKVLEVV